MSNEEIESSAIGIIENEYMAWRDGTIWITDKVYQDSRDIIEHSRKNYLGVFENPINSITGQEKDWIPQTEISIDNAVKSSDIDMKDIKIIGMNPESIKTASVVRAELKNTLYKIGFGEALNLFIRTLGIDGTSIWKTVEIEEDGRKLPKILPVNLLNFYIDQTQHSIADAVKNSGVIERSVISKKEFDSMKGLINTEDVEFYTNKNELDEYQNNDAGTTEVVEMFERYGIIPEYLITGNKNDKGYVDGHIIASKGSGYKIHLIEKTDGKSPYEEAWFIRIPYAWRGRSIAEKLFDIQRSLNRIANTRATRSQISQAGLWTVKKGRGIRQEDMSNLTANGAIFVNEHEDIQQLQVKDVPNSSYQDENNQSDWARQTTSSFESSTGETMPSSMPATNAVISKNAAQGTFDLIKEGLGMFLERWIKNQVFPIIEKNLTAGNIVRVTGDMMKLEDFDSDIATKLAFDKFKKSGEAFTKEDFDNEVRDNMERLSTYGDSRYVNLVKDIKISDYDVMVSITDENSNISIMTQRLVQMMSVAPEFRDVFVKQALDMMGIDSNVKAKPTPEQQAELAKVQGEVTPEGEFTQANTEQFNVQQ